MQEYVATLLYTVFGTETASPPIDPLETVSPPQLTTIQSETNISGKQKYSIVEHTLAVSW